MTLPGASAYGCEPPGARKESSRSPREQPSKEPPEGRLTVGYAGALRLAQQFEAAGRLHDAAAAWDLCVTEAAEAHATSAVDLVEAMVRRTALPVPIPTDVLQAAASLLGGLEPMMAVDLDLAIAVGGFPTGFACYADLLRATTPFSGQRHPAPVTDLGYAKGCGYRASVLLDLFATEDAADALQAALSAAALTPIADIGQDVYREAVSRLSRGDHVPCIELGSTSGDPELVLWLRQLEADLRGRQGDLSAAVAIYQSVALAYGFRGWPMVFSAGQAALVARRFEAAEQIFAALERKAADLFRDQPLMPISVGLAKVGLGKISEAQEYAARANSPEGPVAADLALLLARIAVAREDVDGAAAHYVSAVKSRLQPRREPLGYRFDATTMREVVPDADEGVGYLAEHGRPREALQLGELMKSGRLRAIMSQTPVSRADAPLSSESAATTAARQEVDVLSARLGGLERAILSGAHRANALQPDMAEVMAARQRAIDNLTLVDPTYRAMTTDDLIDVDVLRSVCAKHDVAAVSFYRIDDDVVTTLVDAHGITAARITLADQTRDCIDSYAANLTATPGVDAWNDPAMLGLRLDQLVPCEFVTRMTSARTVLISAHRRLHLLPWGALLVDHSSRLFEKVAVLVTPSLQCAMQLRGPQLPGHVGIAGPPTDVAGLNSLKAGNLEGESVERLYLDAIPPALVERRECNIAGVCDMLGAGVFDTVHLICHGAAIAMEPLSSGFILDGGKMLDAAHIMDIPITAREVVASACSVGWRPDHVGSLDLLGDEALGLPAALLASGVQTLLVSVAKVSDGAAAQLAVGYHRRRAAGIAPPEALRQAQIDLLAEGQFSASQWCSFVVYGSPFASNQS